MIQLTSVGLQTQTKEQIFAELQAAARAALGTNLGVDAEHVLGNILALLAEREALCHEAMLAAHQALDPDASEDAAQDALCAITGTVREAASPSTVTVTATGTAGTVIAAARQVSVLDSKAIFSVAGGTLAALTAWAPTTAYVVGNRRSNASRSYVCITAGTSAGSGGPTTTSANITDGTVHWRYIGDGTAAVDFLATALVNGATQALSGSITVIETPVAGWSSVMNLLDATPGTERETNSALRLRREVELFTQSDAVLGAIYAAVLRVAGVTSASVFQNTSIATVDSLPPKSIEAVVVGGTNQAVIDALFDSVGAGIETYGNTSGTSVDAQGDSQTVKFSRPVVVNVYIIATITKDPKVFPANGGDLVELAIVAAGDLYAVGKDVTASAIVAMVFGACPGVLDASVKLGTAPSPATSATIAISKRQIATFDTSRIDTVLTDGVP